MSNDIIHVCCSCKRLKLSAYTWLNIDVPKSKEISHDTCPECIQKLYPEIAAQILESFRESQRQKSSLKELTQ